MKMEMDDIEFDLKKSKLSGEALLKGTFGLEREGLRVMQSGKLALTPHPKAFGNKLTNPYITTDFSESQIEVVTPVCGSVNEAYAFLTGLCDIVEDELPEDEVFWPQSMPCAIPEDKEIPIARYAGDPKQAEEAMAYRRGLIEKYGGKKQLISGIHYNFALDEGIVDALYGQSADFRGDEPENRQDFKNRVYLKIIRGYLRYRWLIVYLTGCSVACHNSFLSGKMAEDLPVDLGDARMETTGPSLRNSVYGYKNLTPLFLRYDSVEDFVEDVQDFVSRGLISASKELYTQIRMKAKDPAHLLDSLRTDGIQYLELRTVDINPFDPCGISLTDMTFIHHFILWLLTVPEAKGSDWQAEALQNEERTALRGFEGELCLSRDGEAIPLKDWAEAILADMMAMEKDLGLGGEAVIQTMVGRVQNPEKTHAFKLRQAIEEKGYLATQMSQAMGVKKVSQGRDVIFAGYPQADPQTQKQLKAALTRGDALAVKRLIGK